MGLWGRRKASDAADVRNARVLALGQRQAAEQPWGEAWPPSDPHILINLLRHERARFDAMLADPAAQAFVARAGVWGAAQRFRDGSWALESEAAYGAGFRPARPPRDYERRWREAAIDRNALARAVADYASQIAASALDRARVEQEQWEQVRGDRRAARARHSGGGLVIAGNWQNAELLAASALRSFGYHDARTTKGGADGGLDVVGRNVAAQVKYLAKPVGRPVLQQTVGAGGGRQLAVFSRAGYSKAAIEYADAHRIALFTIELPSRIGAVNRAAKGMARG